MWLVVPEALRKELMEETHAGGFFGHDIVARECLVCTNSAKGARHVQHTLVEVGGVNPH